MINIFWSSIVSTLHHYNIISVCVRCTCNALCVYILLLIQWASYVRNVVRNSKGLPIIITLLEANHDPVIRAATTALRNLAIDPRNKAIIGRYCIVQMFDGKIFEWNIHKTLSNWLIIYVKIFIEEKPFVNPYFKLCFVNVCLLETFWLWFQEFICTSVCTIRVVGDYLTS